MTDSGYVPRTLELEDVVIQDVAWPPMDFDHAWATLRAARCDSFLSLRLRRLLQESGEICEVSRTDDEAVIARVAALVAHGRVRLVTAARRVPSGGAARRAAETPPEPEPELAAPREYAWVEFELVGEDEQPIPNEPYELELPDGRVLRGRLGRDGRVRVDDIANPGECVFSLIDLDAEAWVEGSLSSGYQPADLPPATEGHYARIGPGEGTTRIALENGLAPETIWDHENNQKLRGESYNMNVLMPGEELFVPHLRRKDVRKPTNQRHRFWRRGAPEPDECLTIACQTAFVEAAKDGTPLIERSGPGIWEISPEALEAYESANQNM
ncbi:MAG: hypothetical protein PVJ57_21785 [Phycisphaerae bacterium]|jgi:hypothetical protein